MEDIIRKHFPILNEPELILELIEHGSLRSFEPGEQIVDIGQYIKSMPLLYKGGIRVMREDDDGNEILLYFLNSGETCAMTLNCCMSHAKSEVRAVASEASEMIMIPVDYMDIWLKKYSSWKNFVMTSYRLRFEELLQTIDSIAFMKMDQRLEKYLADRAKEQNTALLNITHQEIASDLYTSREVISRLLKQLEKLGRIKLSRNKIEIISLV